MRGLELGHPVIHYLRTFGPPTHALEVVGAAQNGCQLYEAGPKSACLILYVFIGYWVRDENPWNTTQKKMSGWWLTYPSEKYDFVSWDYYSQYMET
jgi:hypothetical protein